MNNVELRVEISHLERYFIVLVWHEGLYANSYPETSIDEAYNQIHNLLPEEPILGESSSLSMTIAQYILDLWLGAWPHPVKNLQLDYSGLSPKTQQILKTVFSIPYGQTKTYQQIAGLASMPNAYRFVGNVMAKNRFPLIIPCHRVVSKQGIGGYGKGTKVKGRLLDAESRHIQNSINI